MLLICAVGLGAGVLGGVIGSDTTILLMPPPVYFYGTMTAVPVIALVTIVANLARVALWRRSSCRPSVRHRARSTRYTLVFLGSSEFRVGYRA